jgi:hypothetical protein
VDVVDGGAGHPPVEAGVVADEEPFLDGSFADASLLDEPFVDGSLFWASDDVDVERLSLR